MKVHGTPVEAFSHENESRGLPCGRERSARRVVNVREVLQARLVPETEQPAAHELRDRWISVRRWHTIGIINRAEMKLRDFYRNHAVAAGGVRL